MFACIYQFFLKICYTCGICSHYDDNDDDEYTEYEKHKKDIKSTQHNLQSVNQIDKPYIIEMTELNKNFMECYKEIERKNSDNEWVVY